MTHPATAARSAGEECTQHVYPDLTGMTVIFQVVSALRAANLRLCTMCFVAKSYTFICDGRAQK